MMPEKLVLQLLGLDNVYYVSAYIILGENEYTPELEAYIKTNINDETKKYHFVFQNNKWVEK